MVDDENSEPETLSGSSTANVGKSEAELRFEKEYDRALARKLKVIEKIRVELSDDSIECPGVIVVGDQSAGKSSVLEGLTGITFPQKAGTCTRTPIVLSLETDPEVSGLIIRVSDHVNGSKAKICKSMKEMHEVLLAKTAKVEKDKKPIQDKPIYVTYIRKEGPIFTVTDLPGIAESDLDNPDFDMKTATTSLVEKYAKNEKSIILFCHPAAIDMQNSKALSVIKGMNNYKDRTIFVFTKCDQLNDNADKDFVKNVRKNQVKIGSKEGFVVIRNRLRGEEQPMDEIEMETFEKEIFRDLRKEEKGFGALTGKVVLLQSQAVDEFIPPMRKKMGEMIKETSKEANLLGTGPPSLSQQRKILKDMLTRIQKEMGALIRSERRKKGNKMLNVGMQTRRIFENFKKALAQMLTDVLSAEYTKEVADAYNDLGGHPIDGPEGHNVLRDQVENLFLRESKERANNLVGEVKEYNLNVYRAMMVTTEEHEQFPDLRKNLVFTVNKILDAASSDAIGIINAIISAEISNPATYDTIYRIVTKGVEAFIATWRNAKRFQSSAADRPATRNTDSTDDEESDTDTESSNGSDTGDDTDSDTDNQLLNSSSGTEDDSNSVIPQQFIENANSELNELLFVFGINHNFLYRWACSDTVEEEDIHKLQFKVFIYSETVLRRIADVISMVVKDKLIFEIHDLLFAKITDDYVEEADLKRLLSERKGLAKRRKDLKERLRTLNKIGEELEEFPALQ